MKKSNLYDMTPTKHEIEQHRQLMNKRDKILGEVDKQYSDEDVRNDLLEPCPDTGSCHLSFMRNLGTLLAGRVTSARKRGEKL